MIAGLLGKKIGMSQHIDASTGVMVPVTMVRIPDNEIIGLKSTEKYNKNAIIVGISPAKQQVKNKKFNVVKEFSVNDISQFTVGQKLNASFLKEIGAVTVSSVSKGKGFQGGMRRWGFHGGPASHGSHFHREPGSVGQRSVPGEVMKGKKLPGHMGCDRFTLKNRPVQHIDEVDNIVYIKGAIPGSRNTLVEIKF